jgi:hypothetical protein
MRKYYRGYRRKNKQKTNPIKLIALTILVAVIALAIAFFLVNFRTTYTPVTIENAAVPQFEAEREEWEGVARVTAYSELDSCHYPDGRGGCLNAYNQSIQDGEIACPLSYKKGTKIEIDGIGTFTCMDKTAQWVQDRNMTFDIWFGYGVEAYREAIEFGAQELRYRVVS